MENAMAGVVKKEREKKEELCDEALEELGWLRTRNAAKESGRTMIDMRKFAAWLRQDTRQLAWRALRRYADRYSSATQIYAARWVLDLWCEESVQQKFAAPSPEIETGQLIFELTRLREALYRQGISSGNMVTTVSFKWTCFLQLLKDFRAVGFLPLIDLEFEGFRSLPQRYVRLDRGAAAKFPARHQGRIPRTLNLKSDSYNDDLLEPISLSASNESYLEEYEARLTRAIQTFRKCALQELVKFEELRDKGRELVSCGDYEWLKSLIADAPSSPQRYLHPDCGRHLFSRKGAHPNHLQNILLIINFEMGGIPRPITTYVQNGSRRTTRHVRGTPPYWIFVQKFGKNNLLPYLGLMSSGFAAACFVLILLEHPKINVASLARASLFDEHGHISLLIDATEGEVAETRLVLQKPRAGSEKMILLTPLAKRVIETVLDSTKLLRAELRRRGQGRAADKLWVGMNTLTFDIIDISEKTLATAFRGQRGDRSWNGSGRNSRRVPFVERHVELQPWTSNATLKSLRVSVGVLEYLRTGGNLVAAAQAFGHVNIKTTISHYIPEALRLAVQERQIRRHQNLLITSAVVDNSVLFGVTDFHSMEELHVFLNSGLPNAFEERNILMASEQEENFIEGAPPVVLCNNELALAVLLLYRRHLAASADVALDRADAVTGLSPRFWCEISDCLLRPLPAAFHEVRMLMQRAEKRAAELQGSIKFPVRP